MVKERLKNAERSQTAAKRRREEENKVLKELAEMLPIPSSVAKNIDKATIIRLTTAYLKLRKLFPKGIGIQWGKGSNTAFRDLGALCNQSLDGFVFILGENAKILYISEAASSHLGIPQLDFIGNSLFNFIHDLDHSEARNLFCNPIPAFNNSSPTALENIEVPFHLILRMKCILAKRQAELAIDGYKIIHCRGYLKLRLKPVLDDAPSLEQLSYDVVGAVVFGQAVPSTPFADIKMNKDDFMFRTGLNSCFTYVEPRVVEIIGHEANYLINKNFFEFLHPCDSEKIRQAIILVIKKNQAITRYYRFLSPGGWIWLQSFCIIVNSSKADHRQHCICFFNQVISKCEHTEELSREKVVKLKAKKSDAQAKKSRSQNNRKKVKISISQESSSSNQDLTSNDLDHIEPSLPLITMPVFDMNNSQNVLHNQELFECYLQPTLVDQNQSLVPPISAFSESNERKSPICTSAISSSNSMSSLKTNNYLDRALINQCTNDNSENAEISAPNEETNTLSPVVPSKIYINYPEAVPGCSVTKIQNDVAKEDELPDYVEPINTYSSENYLENVESNVWTPVAKRLKANKNSLVDFSISSSYAHNESLIVNPIKKFRYNDTLLHPAVNSVKLSDEQIDELFSNPNDKVYPLNNITSSQFLNDSSGNYCTSHRIHNCILCDDSLTENITNVNFIYPSDELQKSFPSISFIQNSNLLNATNPSHVQGLHKDTSFDLNGCILFDANNTSVTSNELKLNNLQISLTNMPFDLKSGMPFESIQTSVTTIASNIKNMQNLVHTSTPFDLNCRIPIEPNQTSVTANASEFNNALNLVGINTPFDFNYRTHVEPNQTSATANASNLDKSLNLDKRTPVDFSRASPLEENHMLMTTNASSSSPVTMQIECFSSIDLNSSPSDNSQSLGTSTPIDFSRGSPLDENHTLMTSIASSSSSVTTQSECFSSIDRNSGLSESTDEINETEGMSDMSSSNASNFSSPSSFLTHDEYSSRRCVSADVDHSSYNSFSLTFNNTIDNQFILPRMDEPETHSNTEMNISNNNNPLQSNPSMVRSSNHTFFPSL